MTEERVFTVIQALNDINDTLMIVAQTLREIGTAISVDSLEEAYRSGRKSRSVLLS